MLIVASCGNRDCERWGAELDFGSSESLDGRHRPAALGAKPEIGCTGGGSLLRGLWLWCGAEQLKTDWQGRGTPAMGQETEVPDAHQNSLRSP
jgi:hypothetical protein